MGKKENHIKIILITFCIALSYFLFAEATHYYRAFTDEKYVITDLHHLGVTGHLTNPGYTSGVAFQFETIMALTLSGVSWIATDLYSPVYGAFALGVLACVLAILLRRFGTTTTLLIALPVASMFAFPVFIKRMMETSHKAHTYVLIFCLLMATVLLLQTRDRRFGALAALFTLGISTTNYIWAVIWGGLAITLIGSTWFDRRRHASLAVGIGLVAAALPLYLPTTHLHARYLAGLAVGLAHKIVGTSTPGGVSGGASAGLIAGWPTVTLFGVQLNVWFLYSAGVFFVAGLAALAGLLTLYEWYSRDLSLAGKLYLTVAGYLGVVCVVLIAVGDIATFKRLIMAPGIFGMLYLAYYVAQYDLPARLPGTASQYSAVCLLILVLCSGAAVKRTVLDGTGQPYDQYASANEVSKVEWVGEYNAGCLESHQKIDEVLYPKRIFERRGYIEYTPNTNAVYDSGNNGVVSCADANVWW